MSEGAQEPKYKRVLLKLSGEALAGERGFGIEPAVVDRLTDEIQSVADMGIALGVVIGGYSYANGDDPNRFGKGASGSPLTAGASVSFAEITSDKGHDAFLLDEPELWKVLTGFIDSCAEHRGLGRR